MLLITKPLGNRGGKELKVLDLNLFLAVAAAKVAKGSGYGFAPAFREAQRDLANMVARTLNGSESDFENMLKVLGFDPHPEIIVVDPNSPNVAEILEVFTAWVLSNGGSVLG